MNNNFLPQAHLSRECFRETDASSCLSVTYQASYNELGSGGRRGSLPVSHVTSGVTQQLRTTAVQSHYTYLSLSPDNDFHVHMALSKLESLIRQRGFWFWRKGLSELMTSTDSSTSMEAQSSSTAGERCLFLYTAYYLFTWTKTGHKGKVFSP